MAPTIWLAAAVERPYPNQECPPRPPPTGTHYHMNVRVDFCVQEARIQHQMSLSLTQTAASGWCPDQPVGISKPEMMTPFECAAACRCPMTAWYSGE